MIFQKRKKKDKRDLKSVISVIKYSPETNLLIYFKFISSLKLNSDFLKSKTRKKNEH